MNYRFFDQVILDTAQECRQRCGCFTDEGFDVMDPTRQGGGTGAVKIVMRSSKLPAWAKPEGAGNHLIRDVAHEKIVSDLGFDLELPVAPVTLSNKTAGMNLHPIVAISYTALVAGRPLTQIPPEASLKLRSALSAMFVFLAWIDDHDHFGGHNAHFEIINGEPRLSFFDFGHSLTKQWMIPGAPPDRPQWRNPPAPFAPLDIPAAGALLGRIEGFPVNELTRIIAGVPPDSLDIAMQHHLIKALDARRHDLRRILNLTGAP